MSAQSTPTSDEWRIRQTLYRAARSANGFELLLEPAVAVDGDDAVVTSIVVGIGGALREPTMIRREPVTDRLHRGPDGTWVCRTRTSAGPGRDLDPAVLAAGRGATGVLTAPPRTGSDRDMLVAVLDLLARYGQCSDGQPPGAGWRDCFVENGVVSSVSPRAGRPPVVLQGRAAIEDAFASAPRPTSTVHLVANVVVEPAAGLRGGSAADMTVDMVVDIASRFVRLDRVGHDTIIGSFGSYRDHAVCCEDGLWRFTRREINLAGRRRPARAG